MPVETWSTYHMCGIKARIAAAHRCFAAVVPLPGCVVFIVAACGATVVCDVGRGEYRPGDGCGGQSDCEGSHRDFNTEYIDLLASCHGRDGNYICIHGT